VQIAKKLLLIPYWIWLILVFLAFLVSSTLISSLFLLVLRKKAQRPLIALYKIWSTLFFAAALIRVKLENKEIVKANNPAIIVSNHGSNLDMFIGAYALPLNTKPLAKVQLKKMPLLGFLFSTACVLIDRSSKESRERGSRRLKQEMQHGYTIFIYPEGTRNRGNEPLNAFYDGAFRFAIEGQVPLIAMCTVGARSLTPSDGYSVQPGTIRVVFMGPYSTKDLTQRDLPTLKEKVFQDMYAYIGKEDPMFSQSKLSA
jgi:1-acyl-sn-glycerol-3-phosphate acyltransferase